MLNSPTAETHAPGILPALFPAAGCPQTEESHSARPGAAHIPPSDVDVDALILAHLQEVRHIARNIARRLPPTVLYEDLVQAGTLGLIDAARRFDRSRPLLFLQYARIRITGAIYDSLRDLDWASRYMRTRQQKLENTAAQLEKALGRQPSSDEIANALGMDLDTFYEFAAAVQEVQRVELDAPLNDEQQTVREQIPSDPDQAPDALLFAKEMREYVRKAIGELPSDERTVMFLYYICDWRMDAIARHIHRTESRVSQIHSRAVARLRQRFRSRQRIPESHSTMQRSNRNFHGVL